MSYLLRRAIQQSLIRPILFMPLIDNLDLVIGTGAATFTRSTIATFINKDSGLLETAAIDAARFESEGVLLEGESTNLVFPSEEFDDVIWAKTRVSISPDTDTAPDGLLTVDKLIEDSSVTNDHVIAQAISVVLGTKYTFSCYVKDVDRRFIMLRLLTGFPDVTVAVDLEEGTISVANGSPDDFVIEELPDGWFRVSITETATVTGAAQLRIHLATGTAFADRVYTGDGVSSLLVWGAQLEELPFASSYIKTIGTSVTRGADNLSIDVVNIPASDADYSVSSDLNAIGIFAAGAGTNQHLFSITGEATRSVRVMDTSGGKPRFIHTTLTDSDTAVVPNTGTKIAVVVDSVNITGYLNNIKTVPTVKGIVTGTGTQLVIGSSIGVQNLYGNMKNFRIFDIALTAQQVASL